MRFLSLFSGIEAASCAWIPMGWECVAVAEIEPFPCAVLAHHYPNVRNLGDITKITREQIEALGHIDVVIGGFPCQDVSVAGLRKGLNNADGTFTRSGLFYQAARIAEWAKARWTLLENVPGLFSSHGGADFTSVVGELAGTEFDIPKKRWQNSGVALGPKGLVEWTVLDAQYFGVAQRRRRVFIVRDSGSWASRPPIFLESESMSGNPPPSRKTGEGSPGDVAARLRSGSGNPASHNKPSGLEENLIPETARSLRAQAQAQAQASHRADSETYLPMPHAPISPAIKARDGKGVSSDGDGDGAILVPMVAHSLRAEHDASEDGTGRGTPLVPVTAMHETGQGFWKEDALAGTLRAEGENRPSRPSHVVAFAQNTRDEVREMEVVGALAAEPGMKQTSYVRQTMQVRRLLPEECEKLQGFLPGYTAIPFRGKQAADGSRYKSLGNSMAVPVIKWIGERIMLVDSAQTSGQKQQLHNEQETRPPVQASGEQGRVRMGS